MKPLAWIEVIDRHGDVASRHPLHAYPAKIGRGYSCDVVLDDPHIAACHLEISALEAGCYQLTDLSSLNGMTIDAHRGRQADARVSADNVVRIGHTQLRIRPADFTVAAEKPLPADTWRRKWTALLLAVPFLMLAYFTSLWAEYDRAESYKLLLQPMLVGLPFLLVWVAFWSILKRGGWANFTAHGVITCFGLGSLLLLDEPLLSYIGFAFNSGFISNLLSFVAEPLAVGVMLYHHVRLVSRSRPRNVGLIVSVLMLASSGLFYVNDKLSDENDFTNMSYSRTVAPPALVLVKGKTSEAFILDAAKLKASADE